MQSYVARIESTSVPDRIQIVPNHMRTSTASRAHPPSASGERPGAITFTGSNTAERRLAVRYPLELGIRFRSLSEKSSFSGVGLVVNASRRGVLVVSRDDITVGARVEMLLDWPFRLDGRIPLQLVAAGRVLRRGKSGFAATIERYEFRTLRSSCLSSDQFTSLRC
jgi:hypothetical protein